MLLFFHSFSFSCTFTMLQNLWVSLTLVLWSNLPCNYACSASALCPYSFEWCCLHLWPSLRFCSEDFLFCLFVLCMSLLAQAEKPGCWGSNVAIHCHVCYEWCVTGTCHCSMQFGEDREEVCGERSAVHLAFSRGKGRGKWVGFDNSWTWCERSFPAKMIL